MKNKEQQLKELNIRVDYHKMEGKKDYEVVWFDSSDEMISKMEKISAMNDYSNDEPHLRPQREGRFSKETWVFGALENYDKTLEYLREGKVLPAVQKRAQEVYDILTNKPEIQEMLQKAETFKRKRVYSEEGAELCIDRVMAGDPAHWQKQTRGRKMPLVKLGLNIAGSAAEDESMFNQIAAVCGVVVDILTRSGFSVELYACSSADGITPENNITTVMTRIKAAEEQIDLNRIYSVGASGFLRCWMFKVYRYVLKGSAYGHLGYPYSVNKTMKDIIGLDYVIDSSFKHSDNNRSAFTKIEGLFEEVISRH